jgi:hypothetical protein
MRIRKCAFALPTLVTAALLAGGCGGASTTNEEGLANGTPVQTGPAKTYKSYGDAIKEKEEAAAQERAAAKKAGTVKTPTSKKAPKSQEEKPKTD